MILPIVGIVGATVIIWYILDSGDSGEEIADEIAIEELRSAGVSDEEISKILGYDINDPEGKTRRPK